MRSPWILAALGLLNALVGATHTRIAVDHPLRIVGPLVVMLVSFVEMQEEGRLSRAYVTALCIFGLGGSAMIAPLLFSVFGQWAMPSITMLVCVAICAISLIPEGKVKWLQS